MSEMQYPFLQGGGEMGELIRRYDWSKTSAGALDEWPVSLRVQISLMLKSRFPMLIFWSKDLITFYNDAFRPSLGEDGKHPGSLGQRGEESWAESWPVIGPMIYSIMAGGEAVWFEDQKLPLYRDGKMGYAYWTYSFSPLVDDGGAVNGILVTCSETTKAVESLQQLAESESRFRSLAEQAPMFVFIADLDGNVSYWNPRWLAFTGQTFEEATGRNGWPQVMHPDDLGGLQDAYFSATAAGKSYEAEIRVRRSDGEYRNILFAGAPRYGPDGAISDYIGSGLDVTAQVQARLAIAESEARFRTLMEEAPMATCLFIGRELTIALANEPMLQSWGKDRSVIGKTLREAMPELEDQPFFEILDHVFTTGETYRNAEAPAQIEVNGKLVTYYFNYILKALRNEAGEVYGIINTNANVTEQVLASQQIAAAESELRDAVELAELGTWSYDLITGTAVWSQRHADIFGMDATEIDFEEAIACIADEDRERVRALFFGILEPDGPKHYKAEYKIINRKTGKHLTIQAIGQANLDEAGKAISITGTTRDITLEREQQIALENEVQRRTEELGQAFEQLKITNEELEETNAQLSHSNEELAQYAYVASHDLQEPLRKIQVFSGMLGNDVAMSDRNRELLQKIGASSGRMTLLIRDLLDFSRLLNSDSIYQPTDLNEVVSAVWNDFELIATEKRATSSIDALPAIEAVSLQMNQLFYNLISNALKFTKPGVPPHIHISAEEVAYDALRQHIRNPLPFARYYRICIADNGIGFEAQYQEQIFEVFKRLHGKDTYPGSGIGLALCRRIVANHHGYLYTTSTPGEGSTFCLILPDKQTNPPSALPQGFNLTQLPYQNMA